ncbi:MAG: anti-sigma factor [Ferrovibrio sp.]|uniref:anti-sigma factor family protein n=1 Tax=Ferrovibrio sp. TaxID=1917215 RepID=UPI002605772E|nr:anti-sigma factor [Ferrovibrio sp.]MCW0232344.1 anti-sigma factor [Ferrovibrio sp.]
MSGSPATKVTEADLLAYVDDRLPPERRADIEAHLALNPEDAARVAGWQNQADDLRVHFAAGLDEPVPAALTAVFAAQRPSLLAPVLRIAAVLGLVVLGAGAGWFGRGAMAPATVVAALPQEAARAHLVYSKEVLHPVEVPAREEQHLVAWLSKRVGTALKVPSLTAQGYGLVGGRLLPASSGNNAAAQFMYENRQGQRLTLYVRSGEGGSDTSFRFAGEGNAAAFYWVDGGFGYALTGEAGREALLPMARVVYEQLTR